MGALHTMSTGPPTKGGQAGHLTKIPTMSSRRVLPIAPESIIFHVRLSFVKSIFCQPVYGDFLINRTLPNVYIVTRKLAYIL